jgi:hypothetical protein
MEFLVCEIFDVLGGMKSLRKLLWIAAAAEGAVSGKTRLGRVWISLDGK